MICGRDEAACAGRREGSLGAGPGAENGLDQLLGRVGGGRLATAVPTANLDPLLPSAVQLFCAAKSLFDHLVGTQQNRLRHR